MALYPKIHEVMGTYTAYWNSEKHNAKANGASRHYCKFVIDTGHYPIIPCLLSSLFWFVMHRRYAFYSYPFGSIYNFQWQKFKCRPLIKLSISPMHCFIKAHRQKAWDDGEVPGVDATGKNVNLTQLDLWGTHWHLGSEKTSQLV